MDSTREIKRRIASVQQTQKVTKAMKMVAAAKLRRNQQRVLAARPYISKIDQVVYSICSYYRQEGHPLLREPERGKTAILLVTADRGLCGGYNTNIIKAAMSFAAEKGGADFFTLGRKGREAVLRAGGKLLEAYMLRFDYPKYETAQRISGDLQRYFLEEGYDEIYIAYQHFNSAISQTPTLLRMLPVDATELEVENLEQVEYIYEPDREGFLAMLLPRYVDNYVYEILLETKASEFGAKMTAMSAATENAGEMIDHLTLTFNQARQSAITREISEVVSGADALK